MHCTIRQIAKRIVEFFRTLGRQTLCVTSISTWARFLVVNCARTIRESPYEPSADRIGTIESLEIATGIRTKDIGQSFSTSTAPNQRENCDVFSHIVYRNAVAASCRGEG